MYNKYECIYLIYLFYLFDILYERMNNRDYCYKKKGYSNLNMFQICNSLYIIVYIFVKCLQVNSCTSSYILNN